MSFINQYLRKQLGLGLLAGLLALSLGAPVHNTRASSGRQESGQNFLHAEGNRILDAGNQPVILTGISWFGLETENYAPHGLWARSLESFLDQVVELGFNTLRIPFSSQLLDPGSTPSGINYDLNPGLQGLSGLEMMDRLIAAAGERGLKVILDRHRPDSQAQSELWYTSRYSEERWIADWVMLAERYAGTDTVIGVDLHNEPRGQATWGTDDPSIDWRLAAERAGNAILKVNPNLLILVQGVEVYQGEYYWWGGNLMGVRDHPVRLDVPGRLIYSTHTYGPGVYPQEWFSDPSFPDNMPAIWDQHWGYVHKEGLAPLIVGEFGGRSVGDDKEGVWQRALVSYLKENQISYIYWTLNPNSGDTGGILLDDWQTVDPNKQALLSSYQFPLIGSSPPEPPPESPPAGSQTEAPAATITAAATSAQPVEATAPQQATAPATQAVALAAQVQVRYRNGNLAERSVDAKPELIIANTGLTPVDMADLELVYWFKDEPGHTYTFTCDWAHIGCQNLMGEFEPAADGLYALHIGFSPGVAVLQPGQDSGEIKVRFNRSDWSEFVQTDDPSYGSGSEYTPWEKSSLYHRGRPVWGIDAGGNLITTATHTPSAAPTEQAALPAATSPAAAPSRPAAATSAPPTAIPAPAWSPWAVGILAAFMVGFAAAWLLRKSR